ncbi:hypothetical protein B7L88_gp101 [Rhizobium phage RHEph10]|uniref:hypothetical protein n=1 Tax=Rhizobium phage RHEph10 TaxID=1220717 RepID=UPI0002AAFC2D|nr:hypothetical protein B7L88_gp101 [Rhizobium phage RHEph10]AGC36187.1 hypothetical protein RHEph10_gp144 [Rhizobium phage RHEph10]
MDIHFNTGRLYTKEGQVIRAVWDKENEVIHFADTSRAVNGSIEAPEWDISFTTPGGLARYVMERYDRHAYKSSAPSWELLMIKGRDPEAQVHQFTL